MGNKRLLADKAAATIEYASLIIFLLAALIAFDRYILRAIWGQWREASETFGHGRQHDPRSFGDGGKGGGTFQCDFVYDDPADPIDGQGTWVRQPCYYDCLNDGKSRSACQTECGPGKQPLVAQYCHF